MKKILIMLVMVFILFNLVFICSLSPPAEDFCVKDSDCIKVDAGCCGCSSGGKATAINKDYKKSYEDIISESCAATSCIAVISDDSSCSAKPTCQNNICVLSDLTIVGNDSDSHGCKGSADYTWCEEKKKCLRGWEENCTDKNKPVCGNGICEEGEELKNICLGLYHPNGSKEVGACKQGCQQDCNRTFPGDGKIKTLPETASIRARERLGELGFNITLKETGKGNETKPVYEAKAKKEGKLFGFIKVNADISAEIDAETGEVTKVHKPWWGFMAGI